MAVNVSGLEAEYPLAAYNYRVIVDNSETLSFSEVSGLRIEHDHVLYRHGFSWLMGDHLIRAQRKPVNVTLKRGVAKQRKYLYDWLETSEKRHVRIELCDESGSVVVSWDISRALPLKLDAPTFSANTNEVAVESLELIAHDLKLSYED